MYFRRLSDGSLQSLSLRSLRSLRKLTGASTVVPDHKSSSCRSFLAYRLEPSSLGQLEIPLIGLVSLSDIAALKFSTICRRCQTSKAPLSGLNLR